MCQLENTFVERKDYRTSQYYQMVDNPDCINDMTPKNHQMRWW